MSTEPPILPEFKPSNQNNIEPSKNEPSQHNVGTNSTDIFGILSLGSIFLGLNLPGFVLGLIGENKAKKEGRSFMLSRIGWIINLVLMLIGLLLLIGFFVAAPAIFNKSTDFAKDVASTEFSNQLEDYYNDKGHYPPNLSAVENENLKSDNTLITYKPTPDGCTECGSYTLTYQKADGTTVAKNAKNSR